MDSLEQRLERDAEKCLLFLIANRSKWGDEYVHEMLYEDRRAVSMPPMPVEAVRQMPGDGDGVR